MNKWKIREVTKYLMCWKEFMIEHNIWERKKDLENIVLDFKNKNKCRSKKIEKGKDNRRIKLCKKISC